MATWLVTGGSGFLGRHVLDALRGVSGAKAAALGRRRPSGWEAGDFFEADLERPEAVEGALRRCRPDFVIHAAGRTPPGDPGAFYRMNTLATLHLLDGLRATAIPARVVLVGSAGEFGPVGLADLPVRDDHPCKPVDAYGLSKWLATCAGLAAVPGLDLVVARVFNPVGPGQPTSQAFGRFAARLLDPAPGPLVAGGLDARRDFVDVRDVARALIALARKGRPGVVYNVGTGASHRVVEGLDHLLIRSGRDVGVRAQTEGPRGPSDSRADVRRIAADTGWRAEVPFRKSLDDLWDAAVARARLPLTPP